MRNFILSALLLASAFQTALGEQDGDWTYIVDNGGATITASTATGAVTIPSEVNGIPVVKVGGNWPPIFGNPNTSVTSVVIPNSVTTIGGSAFYNCTGLTSVTIPNSVTSIESQSFGAGAFAMCTSLASINIPDSMNSVGEYAFARSTSLASINIPNSVTNIGSSAFEGCSGLTSVVIGNGVMSIGFSTFKSCTGLTSISIPNSVTSIGNDALSGCTSLTSITMPDRFISQVATFGLRGQVATDYLVNALANNDAFVTAVANKIKGTAGNYGIATQTQLATTQAELATTKSQITTAINEGKASGIASVTASPNTWSLFTTSQIQNMAVGDLVLTKNVGGTFTLNYDIEQSTDLQTWTTYAPLSLPLTGLPTDKAFVRIKAKQ